MSILAQLAERVLNKFARSWVASPLSVLSTHTFGIEALKLVIEVCSCYHSSRNTISSHSSHIGICIITNNLTTAYKIFAPIPSHQGTFAAHTGDSQKPKGCKRALLSFPLHRTKIGQCFD